VGVGQQAARLALEAGLAELDPGLDETVRDTLLRYVDLLVRWNRSFNLTGTKDPAEIVRRHLLDSLSIAPFLRGSRVLDAGTGAGLPGVVLAAARPQIGFTLLDSSGKKTRFCLQAAAELSLRNVQVVRARLEEYEAEAPFTCVVSRAFEGTPELVAKCRHLLAPGGAVLAMKGAYPKAELEALEAAGRSARVLPLSVPELGADRHLLLVEAC
jgi:16S rRNA (guanine527-N7)-methyltransferase